MSAILWSYSIIGNNVSEDNRDQPSEHLHGHSQNRVLSSVRLKVALLRDETVKKRQKELHDHHDAWVQEGLKSLKGHVHACHHPQCLFQLTLVTWAFEHWPWSQR